MAEYQKREDIVNRGLQIIGVPRIDKLADSNLNATEANASYDKVRKAELRRNLWTFATRTACLRALDTTSRFLTFEAYAAGTTYAANYVVSYLNMNWVSNYPGNVGNTPGTDITSGQQAWSPYFGPQTANAWNDTIENTDTTNNLSYRLGEPVYLISDGTIWISNADGNQNEPDVVDEWDEAIMYSSGEVISYNSVTYQSLVNLNFDNTPSSSPSDWTVTVTNPTVSRSWVKLASASLVRRPIIYPVNAGPANDPASRNAFFKPAGYLRSAPLSPKAGARAWQGAHVGLAYSDRIHQGNYITTASASFAIVERFVADVTDVASFDDMFDEGLAARLAMELAPRLAPDKIGVAAARYREAMSEARTVDAIELGPVEQDEDELITVRR